MRLILRWFCIVSLLISCSDRHNANPSLARTDQVIIGILPYQGFDTSLSSFVQNEIEKFYPCKTVLLLAVALPADAYYKPRNRYKAGGLLRFQLQFTSDSVDVVVGLTDKDISTSNGDNPDWGIFGLGYQPGRACVISTKRLVSATDNQFRERLIKVVLHELGHNLGLPHCNNHPECMMNDAKGKMATVDKEKKWLCDNCKTKIDY